MLMQERREVLIMMQMEPQDHPSHTRNNVEVHVAHFGQPVAYGFVLSIQESWMIKTSTSADGSNFST